MGSQDIMMQPEGKPRSWFRDNFLLTTDKSYLDPRVVNEAFRSDLMWWNDPLQLPQMEKMLDNCLTLGVYWVSETEEQMKKLGGVPRRQPGPDFRMVGFARIVTDYVTIAYLTDVFVLEEFQRRGLASWMMRAVKDVVDEWPNLRGLMLMTHDEAAARLYKRELGVLDFAEGPSKGLVMLEMAGNGQKDLPNGH